MNFTTQETTPILPKKRPRNENNIKKDANVRAKNILELRRLEIDKEF